MERVVFDTSVVVSALLFRSGQLSWLRGHWRERNCVSLVSPETGSELAKVLRHKKFRLPDGLFHEALAAYLPYCEIVDNIETCSVVCRDPKDQPFLDLAESGNADSLVSGDKDLLALAGKTSFRIEAPETYRQRVIQV